MQYRLLGPLEVVDDGRPVAIGGGKPRALLALLLMNANKVVAADRLIDELWGESPPPTAAKSVQVHVSHLRKALRAKGSETNGQVVVTRGNGYALHVEDGELDVQLFEGALAEAQRSLEQGDPRLADQRLREALDLWRGPALADFAYEPFAQQEISRLEELRLTALEARVDARLELGEHDRLIGELEGLVRAHPLRERFCAQLMLALYRSGRQAEALAAYRQAERMFRDELGIEPTPALRELEQRILEQDPDLAPPRAPPRRKTAPPATTAAASPRRPLPLRWPVLVTAAALLLGAAATLAVFERVDGDPADDVRSFDVATNSLVAVSPDGAEPELVVPLPGRPTGVTATPGHVWIASVDSSALTGVDTKERSISRTAPLRGEPDAVAAGYGSIWVSDGARGVLARFRPGYSRPAESIPVPRARPAPAPPGRRRVPRSALAIGAGAVWITNGSRELVRVDPGGGKTTRIPTGARLNDVAVGAGVVWAISARTASVFRIDPRDNTVERIRIAGRSGGDAPFPIGVAAGERWVWVLNGNTATVTTIDPSTRGVLATVQIGADRVPNDIAGSRGTAWVANGDGTLARIDGAASTMKSIWVGESLEEIATDGSRLWATTSAFDQRFPGGAQ